MQKLYRIYQILIIPNHTDILHSLFLGYWMHVSMAVSTVSVSMFLTLSCPLIARVDISIIYCVEPKILMYRLYLFIGWQFIMLPPRWASTKTRWLSSSGIMTLIPDDNNGTLMMRINSVISLQRITKGPFSTVLENRLLAVFRYWFTIFYYLPNALAALDRL